MDNSLVVIGEEGEERGVSVVRAAINDEDWK